jgi:UDP-N-acetylglucosamine--N-acetylmuramyl-(pentapeptide) pyrophosphoryl-undecaprenol N-acetylglucosamine transferase
MTGGGTGGHLAIIDAVKEHIDSDLVYIGSVKGQDRAWFEDDAKFNKKYFLESTSYADRGKLGKLLAIFTLAKQVGNARKILKEHNAKVVFSVGGYSAAPASFAAVTMGIPLVIHEQNAHIGLLNRALKPFAKHFISSYDSSSPIKAYATKKVFFDTARVREEIKTILISGGSQGAQALNKLALKLAPELDKRGIKIYHQAGEKNLASVKAEYEKLGINAEVFGFTKQMPQIIAKADFAIARAGASTLWEMVANGLPALFVPYPYAAGDHQYYNAKYLVDNNLAYLMRQDELNIDKSLEIIDNIDLENISSKLIKLNSPDSAKDIAKLLEELHN